MHTKREWVKIKMPNHENMQEENGTNVENKLLGSAGEIKELVLRLDEKQVEQLICLVLAFDE